MKKRIQLSDHFTYNRLLRFSLPSIMMIICTSIYSIVDGFFVSNYVGKTPFAALNLIMPVLMAAGAIGFMLGTGGSAIVSRLLGADEKEKAHESFSLIILFSFILGVIISAIGFIFTEPISVLLGADDELLKYCVLYGRICFAFTPFFILQYMFQSFFVAAEKPQLSLWINIIAGVVNAILDLLLVAVFPMGLAGAAIATGIGQVIGGLVPVIYFLRENDSLLKFVKPRMDIKTIVKACTNGSSEMVNVLAASVVGMLYNHQLLKIAGQNGVAAYGIIMYINMIFQAVFMGYAVGTAPIVSYHYGAQNTDELKSLRKKSINIIIASGGIMLILSELLARPLVMIFANYDKELLNMTVHGFMLYSISFLIMGFNVWGSAFFTALGDGFTSATISFLRTFLFQIVIILVLPLILKTDGIWLAIVVAEALGVIVTTAFLISKRHKYNYA